LLDLPNLMDVGLMNIDGLRIPDRVYEVLTSRHVDIGAKLLTPLKNRSP
jgi:hypothetical protein